MRHYFLYDTFINTLVFDNINFTNLHFLDQIILHCQIDIGYGCAVLLLLTIVMRLFKAISQYLHCIYAQNMYRTGFKGFTSPLYHIRWLILFIVATVSRGRPFLLKYKRWLVPVGCIPPIINIMAHEFSMVVPGSVYLQYIKFKLV